MKKIIIITLKFIPMILIMGTIFYFSSMVGDDSSEASGLVVRLVRKACRIIFAREIAESHIDTLTFIIRKCAHMSEYALCGWFTIYAIKGLVRNKWAACIFAETIVILYAISDEFHQYFVPGRSASPLDVCIDSLGAMIGIWVFMVCAIIIDNIKRKKKKRKRK